MVNDLFDTHSGFYSLPVIDPYSYLGLKISTYGSLKGHLPHNSGFIPLSFDVNVAFAEHMNFVDICGGASLHLSAVKFQVIPTRAQGALCNVMWRGVSINRR